MSKRWIIEPPWEGSAEAAARWGVSPLVAQLLFNRGLGELSEAESFLAPRLKDLYPPARLPGAQNAARIIAEAVRGGRRVVIYGDYDVDGITGVAILWRVLTCAGANVDFYVPDRIQEGYGLHPEAVRGLAEAGAELIVTVDCGVTGVEAAALLRERGVTLIITDHHLAGPALPEAAAIVHPRLATDGAGAPASSEYPNPDLSGSGVAFKVGWAVAQELCGAERVSTEMKDVLTDALPLAALGTIADIVPLVDENRILARHGLTELPRTRLPGLAALLESAGLSRGTVDGTDVGFKLAPRLNAAGRMGHARLAVELLTRADTARGREIARVLEQSNRARQAVERQIFRDACERIDGRRLAADSRRGIVLASSEWHPGVIGIVAARIVERYSRPTILISTNEGEGQGSGRTFGSFDLHAALQACATHLTTYGGHAKAAGLKLKTSSVEAFEEAFVDVANRRLMPADLVPGLRIDAEVPLSALTLEAVDQISRLEPFGQGNPRPRFCTGWIELSGEPRCVGEQGTHMQVLFRENGAQMKGIGFGMASLAEDLKEHRRCRAAFEPILNTYQGRTTVEMKLVDLQFPS